MNRASIVEPPASIVAEAQRLYEKFHARCFWSYRRNLTITPQKIAWVRDGLRKHGGMMGWRAAERLVTHD